MAHRIKHTGTWLALLAWLTLSTSFLPTSIFSQTETTAQAAEKTAASADTEVKKHTGGGEANLKLPDLSQAKFLGGLSGTTLLYIGLFVSAFGLLFGMQIYIQLKALPFIVRCAKFPS